MRPRFVGHLGLADVITAINAAIGFLAIAALTINIELTARLILLAGIADALDGLIARMRGGTAVGEYLDGLADVASFGIAPAGLVFMSFQIRYVSFTLLDWILILGVPAVYVMVVVIRLGLYTTYDTKNNHTIGVPSTLAGTILAVGLLVGIDYFILLIATAIFIYLMVAPITYPDLLPRDAFIMGLIQIGAVVRPQMSGLLFPKVLLIWALAYLVLGPRFYWRNEGKRS
ncbi:MAG: protein sorting system archaetidylserine synthase [Halobacteriaceae archaeon]